MLKLIKVSVTNRVQPFSSQVNTGCQIHLIGPNGAGKSTLLARLAGILPGKGEVYLNQQLLESYSPQQIATQRGYLPQQQNSQVMMPIFQYLALHLKVAGQIAEVERVIKYLTQRLDLYDKLEKSTLHLSGGEWQRVRLVAILLQVWPTLVGRPSLLLLDEPMNSLDVAQQAALNQLLTQFCQAGGSVIISTHDLNHTLHFADRVWLMNKGQLCADGDVQQVMIPERLSDIFNVNFQLQQIQDKSWIMANISDIYH